MSTKTELAERIRELRDEQDADIEAVHVEHHARIKAANDARTAAEKASTEQFHADKARIRARYAAKIDPLVAEHDALAR